REHTAEDQQLAQFDAMGGVDVQYIDGGTPTRCQTDQPRPVPFKVTTPALTARIEQHHDATGDHVAAAQIARFAGVAFKTRPSQVVGIVDAVVLLGDDVFDMETEERLIRFVQTAILTALLGPQADERANRSFHAGCPLRAKRMRALALRTAMK